jgi:hypothetical protein
MKLPLQMPAVSRSRFRKSHLASSVGRVLPSWSIQCAEGTYACTCTGSSLVACCGTDYGCNCGTGSPVCSKGEEDADNGHHHPGGKNHIALTGDCDLDDITCYDKNGTDDNCSNDLP